MTGAAGPETPPGPEPAGPETPVGPDAPVCATCGAVAPDASRARLSWARGIESGREVWTCEVCSRRHVRSIEGKLDSAWW